MSESKPYTENKPYTGTHPDWDVQLVVEQIWSDLGGAVSRTAIRQEVAQVIPAFADARITTYVPIFVRRRTLAQLRTGSTEFTEKLA
jgi:hypothetical protein